MKRPSFQFYPGDWLHDTGLRACSLAARGLWIDIVCFMHQAEPYGHLTFPAVNDRKDVLRPSFQPSLHVWWAAVPRSSSRSWMSLRAQACSAGRKTA